MAITDMTALELAEKIKQKEITSLEATKAVFENIAKKENDIHAYISYDKEAAISRAKHIDEMIMEGKEVGAFAGVPFAIKDNISTKGVRTTCASRILYRYTPTFSATAYENLEASGAVLVGKTNMDEFAMGSTSETSAFGVTKNPRNIDHVPGGSSGGSCAAVAADEAYAALGSDTGGSIRQPSAYCGVVGMKPTYGTVSRYGLIAYASSLDQIGPIAKDVSDCATILDVISSKDAKDSTSESREYEFSRYLTEDIKGLRIGIPSDYFTEGLDGQVASAVRGAAEALKTMGATVEEFDLGYVKYAIPAYYTIAAAEASSNLERFDGVKYGYRAKEYDGLHQMYKKSRSEGFGDEVKRRIMLGSFVLSSGYYDAYYLKALKIKALIKQTWDAAFEKYDVVIAPVAPTTAPRIGESLTDPLKMYLSDIYTISVNLAGLPGLSLPCGVDSKGLPIGMQLIGDRFMEGNIIKAGYAFEKSGCFDKTTIGREA